MEADVAEALDDEGLAAPARGLTDQGHVGGLQDKVLQPVVHATTRGRGASVDTTLNKIVDSEAFFKNKIKAVKRAQNYREIFLYPILPGFLNGPRRSFKKWFGS